MFAQGGVYRKRVLDSRSSRVNTVRTERVCVENEEPKEASMVRAKGERWSRMRERQVHASFTGSDKHEDLHPC